MKSCLDIDLRKRHAESLLVTFLDVGQGHSVLLRLPDNGDGERFGVIDSHWHFPQCVPAPLCLAGAGIRDLEFVVLTHPHEDHYLGIGSLLEDYSQPGYAYQRFLEPRLTSQAVLIHQLDRIRDLKAGKAGTAGLTRELLYRRYCGPEKRGTRTGQLARIFKYAYDPGNQKRISYNTGDALDLTRIPGELRCTVISPDWRAIEDYIVKSSGLVSERPDTNAISLGLLLTWESVPVLVCGDMPDAAWDVALKTYAGTGTLKSSLVDVGHHGGSGNGDDLWDAITLGKSKKRTWAVISCGYRNSYRHPQEATLKRILDRGCYLLCINKGNPCESLDVSSASSASPVAQGMAARARAKRPLDEGRFRLGQKEAICSGQITLAISPKGHVTVAHRENEAVCAFERDVLNH